VGKRKRKKEGKVLDYLRSLYCTSLPAFRSITKRRCILIIGGRKRKEEKTPESIEPFFCALFWAAHYLDSPNRKKKWGKKGGKEGTGETTYTSL